MKLNNDVLKREAINKAAGLARGDGLSVLYRLCEKQKTISTKKVLEHIERTHEFMKDCAYHMAKLEREIPPNDTECTACEGLGAHPTGDTPVKCGGCNGTGRMPNVEFSGGAPLHGAASAGTQG